MDANEYEYEALTVGRVHIVERKKRPKLTRLMGQIGRTGISLVPYSRRVLAFSAAAYVALQVAVIRVHSRFTWRAFVVALSVDREPC
jgi:hypothetical protein